VDEQGLTELFATGSFRLSGEVFRGIKPLRPAHSAVVQREGLQLHRYWKLENAPHTDTMEDTVQRVRSLLADTVKRQLVADVPVAFLLSGGLDSSGVAALGTGSLREQHQADLPSFTVDFKDEDQHFKPNIIHRDRDPVWARRVAEHLGIPLHEVVLDVPELIDH